MNLNRDIHTNHLVLVIQIAVTGSLVGEDAVSHIAAKKAIKAIVLRKAIALKKVAAQRKV
ncbi:hypothetical protein UF15_02400 [Bacillus sp. L_1B0_12]|uniref:Uncharacterized protein n=1 Tax=Bacillus altitudinis TaxID=293387 RepID=A0A653NUK4_BACAB|nr:MULTISPECIES: hypothetical protein [Bacillus]KKK11287.1 hypothetical protein UF15_02400 [Bacillus sp. L_1B0_12]QAR53645.1 hypothetical protein BAE_12930 [Bacillus aerophilus]AMB89275.1 hypothetical protein ASM07_04955 [Bacillus altitudinis]QDZ93549.1 hypothetical protein D0438_01015 [Bacillus altitudinis]VXB21141.1 conserved hypothetical protein [Bacillus altitudinis]